MFWLLIHRNSFDAVVTSSPPIFTGIAAIPLSVFGRTGWVVDVRDLWIDASVGLGFIEEGGVGERLARRYQRFVLQKADRVTVTTTVLGERLVEQYGIDNEKVVHLPNGVDTERFESSGSASDPVIVYTGNVGHAQDLKSCVLAMKELDRQDVMLKIVGDGDIKPDLEQLAHQEGLDEQVQFTGLVPREEIPEILDNAMIGIAPLHSTETLEYAVPTKAYEYMAAELPVVATGIGEIEALMDDSGGGRLVDNDPEAITDTFAELLRDNPKRSRLGSSGRDHVVETYDRRIVATRLSEVLREVGAS
jgi:glycosyltransferase involved in cell wall biosynthesis